MINIYGINKKLNFNFYKKWGMNIRQYPLKYKVGLSSQTFLKLHKHGSFLQLKIKKEIHFVINNKTFKGIRHKKNYPTRGQRTHTNAKTRKKQ